MFSTTSLYTKAGFQVNQNIEWNMLTEDQCEVIVLTAMEILERTGADVLCAEARKTAYAFPPTKWKKLSQLLLPA